MDAVNYSSFRKVNDGSEALTATNKDPEDNAAVMSQDEYDALIETAAKNV